MHIKNIHIVILCTLLVGAHVQAAASRGRLGAQHDYNVRLGGVSSSIAQLVILASGIDPERPSQVFTVLDDQTLYVTNQQGQLFMPERGLKVLVEAAQQVEVERVAELERVAKAAGIAGYAAGGLSVLVLAGFKRLFFG